MNSDHKYTNKNTLYIYYFKRPEIPNFVPYEFTLLKHLIISVGKLRTQQGTGSWKQAAAGNSNSACRICGCCRCARTTYKYSISASTKDTKLGFDCRCDCTTANNNKNSIKYA